MTEDEYTIALWQAAVDVASDHAPPPWLVDDPHERAQRWIRWILFRAFANVVALMDEANAVLEKSSSSGAGSIASAMTHVPTPLSVMVKLDLATTPSQSAALQAAFVKSGMRELACAKCGRQVFTRDNERVLCPPCEDQSSATK